MNTRDLLYAIESGLYAVFVPRELVDEMLIIRQDLPECRTWGDARKLLSDRWLRELYAPGAEPLPDELFELEDLPNHWHAWPALNYEEIRQWLPDEIVDKYGEPFDGMAFSGVHMPASQEDEIVAALRGIGISCEQDDQIVQEQLFNYEL